MTYQLGKSGLLMQSGIGWKPYPEGGPNHVQSVMDTDYVREIARLVEENASLRRDANRWRALMASARIRMMGWAGFGPCKPGDTAVRDPDGYRHMGVELWTKTAPHPSNARENMHARCMFYDYTETMMAIQAKSTIPAETE